MASDERHAHFFDNAPDGNPDEVVYISGGPMDRARPAFVLEHQDGTNGPLLFHPLLARHLQTSGWVRLGTDDVALLRIADALEALAPVPPAAVVTQTAELLREVADIEERRRPRSDT